MKKRPLSVLLLVVALLLPQTAFAWNGATDQLVADAGGENPLLTESHGLSTPPPVAQRNAYTGSPFSNNSSPLAAPENFPGTIAITSTPVTGTTNVFDTKNVNLRITFTPDNPVDEIQINAQRGNQSVTGYPKNITIRPSQFNAGISEQLTLAEGVNTVTVRVISPASTGVTTLTIIIVSPAPTATTTTPAPAASPTPSEYDWGRVRAYFTGGVIFSKEREDFSKTDLALAFVLDKNYLQNPIFNINTFFEARLTSIPVSATLPTAAASASPTPTPAPAAATSFDSFVASRKAGFAQAGVYVPINVSFWINQRRRNTLFVAPLAKGGVMTITGDRQTAEATVFGDDDVYNFFSYGIRLGHFRYHRLSNPCKPDALGRPTREKPTDDCEVYEDYAPELVSWLDITRGKWENFDLMEPTTLLDVAGNIIRRPVRRWRWQAEGRLKIPETPFIIGFDGNFGKGPDDLRFGFGIRFDVGRVLRTLKIADALEKEAAQPAAAAAKP
ncbi:MAG TPA: hypothetical protein VF717_17565 [Pyrinomonadaceae bacterium]|jgi:hypothetical protein